MILPFHIRLDGCSVSRRGRMPGSRLHQQQHTTHIGRHLGSSVAYNVSSSLLWTVTSSFLFSTGAASAAGCACGLYPVVFWNIEKGGHEIKIAMPQSPLFQRHSCGILSVKQVQPLTTPTQRSHSTDALRRHKRLSHCHHDTCWWFN